MSAKVAILGGGLSAAFAWRALRDNNITPDVITERIFTPPGGCIWVHKLPKSVDSKKLYEPIHVEGVGSTKTYAEKMWGRELKTSFPSSGDYDTKGVNPLVAARLLWGDREVLKKQIKKGRVDEKLIKAIKKDYDLVIQTFPLGSAKPKWETPILVGPRIDTSLNLVSYQGNADCAYVRYSFLFSIPSWEFPPQQSECRTHSMAVHQYQAEQKIYGKPGYAVWYAPEIPPQEIAGKLAVESYADGNVLYCGRWATGNRKFLSHEVYDRVVWHLRREKLIE